MDAISKIYTTQIHHCFMPLYATWQPELPVRLGDFGLLDNNLFIPMGNIDSYGITFSTRTNSGAASKSYYSKHGVDFKLSGKADVQDVRASLEISFNSEDGVFFNAAGCVYTSIEQKKEIGDKILWLYRQKKWILNNVIVTDMVTAKNTLIVLSGGNQSGIKLEADENVSEIDLSSASLSLNLTTQKNIGFIHKSTEEIVPLVGFCRIQSRFFGSDVFEPEFLLPEVENSDDDLYFDELRS